MFQAALAVFFLLGHFIWCIYQISFNWNVHYFVALLIHIFCFLNLILEHFGQKAINNKTLDAKNSFEHAESIIKVQEWLNKSNLENNLYYYMDYEENGDGEIDSPVSDIVLLDNIESANKLSVGAVEKPKTPKQHTPFKISTFTSSEVKTHDSSDTAKESLRDTSTNSRFNDKEDTIHFSNADFEVEEPELIEIFKNSINMKDRFLRFNENYYFYPISTEETQGVANTDVSENIETSQLSTSNNYLANPSEKNSLHDAVFAYSDPTAVFANTDPTAVFADTDPTAVFADTDPTAAFADANPTAVCADTGPIAVFADTDPIAVSADTDPTAAFADTDPTAAFADTVSTAVFADTDPTAAFADTDPTAAFADANPTAVCADTGPIAVFADTDPIAVSADTDPTAASSEEFKGWQLPNNSEISAIDCKKQKKRKIFGKVQKFFKRMKKIKTSGISYQRLH
ncbi:hypothetical protein TNCT_87781 [Trichonephila clavata]|uniref:Uncharacterized protein n=1 Tax=Trichonephila clavata TaxID=2740835 RepID=A0A8X6HNK6_TRICU|nr:hypothetical protein TNCT_87781 [Trichonephila clavata]